MKQFALVLPIILAMGGSIAFGQSQGEEKLFVLPLAGYSSQFGFGGGVNAAWINIDDTSWLASTAAYIGTLYSLNFIVLDLVNRHFLDIFYVDVGGSHYQNFQALFYGFGNNSDLANSVQFSAERSYLYAKMGIRFLDDFIVGGGVSQGTMGIDRGANQTLAQYLDVYGTNPTASGLTTTFTELFLTYDTRRPETAPQGGDLVSLSVEQSQPLGDETLAEQHLELIAENFLSISEKDLLLLTHLKYERTWGDNIPFYIQSPIGGLDTLRGFNASRFIDVGSLTLNFEPRWSIWSPNGSFIKRLELSTAFELGRVFSDGLLPPSDSFHTDEDFGFTVVLSGDLPLRFDYAIGPETSLVYLNLFYPF